MADESRDDLEPRVSALEREVADLRAGLASADTNAAAARILAAGADRDVSEVRAELRAHLRAITALGQAQRETRDQLRAEIGGLRREMHAEIGGLRRETHAEIGSVRSEVGSLRSEMRAGFATMHTGMTRIVELLDRPGDGS